ncbi:unnamed protein product [Ectocarpus sp. 12 AP-2014]
MHTEYREQFRSVSPFRENLTGQSGMVTLAFRSSPHVICPYLAQALYRSSVLSPAKRRRRDATETTKQPGCHSGPTTRMTRAAHSHELNESFPSCDCCKSQRRVRMHPVLFTISSTIVPTLFPPPHDTPAGPCTHQKNNSSR